MMSTILSVKYLDDCVAVELDGGESLKIPLRIAAQFPLAAGSEISDDGYRMLKEESRRYLCRRSALDFLAIRPRSISEMERYLKRKGFDADMIRDAVTALAEGGYLDDADYAARYVSARLRKRLVGRNLLAGELQKRGISRQIIRQVLSEASSRFASVDDVHRMALKKYAALKHATNGLARLASFLRNRGFDGETIATVIDRIRSGETE